MKNLDALLSNVNIDTPILSMNEDEFGREKIVQNLSSIIRIKNRTVHPCYTIGIYGKWGEGKTSFLNMLERELAKEKNTVIIKFNPWFFKDQESLLLDFFNTLAGEKLTKKVVDAIKKYGPVVSMGIGRILDFSFVPGVGEIVNHTTQEFIKNLPGVDINIRSEKERVNKVIEDSKKRLLIFIDDVDRLDKEEIHILFKLIKQNADFINTTYLLSMDLDMVAKSICNKFENGEELAGKKFIEKIVQIPIHLPKISKAYLAQYFERRMNVIFEDLNIEGSLFYQQSVSDAKQKMEKYLYPLFTTARQINQYLNILSFSLPLIYQEINIADFCLLEALKVFDNNVYVRIKNNKHIFLSIYLSSDDIRVRYSEKNEEDAKVQKDEKKKFIESLSEDTPLDIKYYINGILKELLYPYIYNSYDFSTEQNNRLLSKPYFDRYFIYETPSEYISDAEYEKLALCIHRISVDDLTIQFDTYLKNYTEHEFKRIILKLLYNRSCLQIDKEKIQKICIALSRMEINKKCVTKEKYLSGFEGFIYDILKQYMSKQKEYFAVPDEEMIQETIRKIAESAPVLFSVLFIDLAYNLNYNYGETPIENYTIVYDLIKRLLKEKEIDGFCGLHPTEFSHLCYVWKLKNPFEYEEYLDKIFNNDGFNIKDLLYYFHSNGGFELFVDLYGKERIFRRLQLLKDYIPYEKEILAFNKYITEKDRD